MYLCKSVEATSSGRVGVGTVDLVGSGDGIALGVGNGVGDGVGVGFDDICDCVGSEATVASTAAATVAAVSGVAAVDDSPQPAINKTATIQNPTVDYRRFALPARISLL